MQQRAQPFQQDPQQVTELLQAGAEKARAAARDTMAQVRAVMHLSPP